MPGTESEIEIRQVFEAEDFGEEFTPELREQEDRLRAELEQRVAERLGGGALHLHPQREEGHYFFLFCSCASFCSR